MIKLSKCPKLFAPALALSLLFLLNGFAQAEVVRVGDTLNVSLKGVPQSEQVKVNSELEVRDDGFIRVPLINVKIKAAGLQPDVVERSIEQAFVKAQIYSKPTITIKVVAKKKIEDDIRRVVTVGGQVKNNRAVQYRKGMTLLQAIQQAGGRTPFASKYVFLTRNKKRYLYNIKQAAAQNLKLYPDDTVNVPQQNGPFDSKPKMK